jgi:hypothetical protein
LQGFIRKVPNIAVSLALVVILVLGTGIASAEAVPGDVLYPVKLARERTQLFFVTDPVRRLELEQSFDQERTDETEVLIEHRRESEVTFSGTLTRTASGKWMVSEINLVFPPQLESQAMALQNSYVEAHGMLQSDGTLLVERISLHQLEFSGVLQGINGNQWTVSRVPLVVDKDTIIIGTTRVGGNIRVKATRREDGTLVASEINGEDSGKEGTPQITPTQTPGEFEDYTETPAPTMNSTLPEPEDQIGNNPSVTPSPDDQYEPDSTETSGVKPTRIRPTESDDNEHHSSSRTPTPTPASGDSEPTKPPRREPTDDHLHQPTPTPEHESQPTATPTSRQGDH